MSELLNSGQVGVRKKTVEETVDTWSHFGLLEGLTDKEKIKIALLYEKTAEILLNVRNVYAYNSSFDVVIFPMVRKIAMGIKRYESNEQRAEGMFHLLTAEFITKRTSEIYPDAIELFEKHFSKTLGDVEAECTAWISDIIANEYINSFSKKDIISLGDNKFEVVVKIKD
jgi:hypothetical protein